MKMVYNNSHLWLWIRVGPGFEEVEDDVIEAGDLHFKVIVLSLILLSNDIYDV